MISYLSYWPSLIGEDLGSARHSKAVVISFVQSLDHLFEYGEDKTFTVTTMCEHLNMGTSTAERLLKELNEEGWLERRGRRVVVCEDKTHHFKKPYVHIPFQLLRLSNDERTTYNHLFLYADVLILYARKLFEGSVERHWLDVANKYDVSNRTIQTARERLIKIGLIETTTQHEVSDKGVRTVAVRYRIKEVARPVEKKETPPPNPPPLTGGKIQTYFSGAAANKSHEVFQRAIREVISGGKKREIENWLAFHITNKYREVIGGQPLVVVDSKQFKLLNKFVQDIFMTDKATKDTVTTIYDGSLFTAVRYYLFQDKYSMVDTVEVMEENDLIATYHYLCEAIGRATRKHKGEGLSFGLYPSCVAYKVREILPEIIKLKGQENKGLKLVTF